MEEKGADWTVFFFNAESFIIETNPTLLLCTNGRGGIRSLRAKDRAK